MMLIQFTLNRPTMMYMLHTSSSEVIGDTILEMRVSNPDGKSYGDYKPVIFITVCDNHMFEFSVTRVKTSEEADEIFKEYKETHYICLIKHYDGNNELFKYITTNYSGSIYVVSKNSKNVHICCDDSKYFRELEDERIIKEILKLPFREITKEMFLKLAEFESKNIMDNNQRQIFKNIFGKIRDNDIIDAIIDKYPILLEYFDKKYRTKEQWLKVVKKYKNSGKQAADDFPDEYEFLEELYQYCPRVIIYLEKIKPQSRKKWLEAIALDHTLYKKAPFAKNDNQLIRFPFARDAIKINARCIMTINCDDRKDITHFKDFIEEYVTLPGAHLAEITEKSSCWGIKQITLEMLKKHIKTRKTLNEIRNLTFLLSIGNFDKEIQTYVQTYEFALSVYHKAGEIGTLNEQSEEKYREFGCSAMKQYGIPNRWFDVSGNFIEPEFIPIAKLI